MDYSQYGKQEFILNYFGEKTGILVDIGATDGFNNSNTKKLIEMAGHDKEKDEKCREILKNNGFKLSFPLGCNEVWVNENNK
jgi:hypothetical protein